MTRRSTTIIQSLRGRSTQREFGISYETRTSLLTRMTVCRLCWIRVVPIRVFAVFNGLMITALCKPISRIKCFQPIVPMRLARKGTSLARWMVIGPAVIIAEMAGRYSMSGGNENVCMVTCKAGIAVT